MTTPDLPPLDGMMLTDLIDLLVAPPEPAPVSLWPQTGGWIVLGAGVLVAAIGLAWVIWRRWRAEAYRRHGLRALSEAPDAAAQLAVLRRVALTAYPRREVAGLTGAAWLARLDSLCPDGPRLSGQTGAALLAAAYRPGQTARADPAPLAHWIAHHDRAAL